MLSQSPAAAEEFSPPDGNVPAKKPVQTTWHCCRRSRRCPDFFRWDLSHAAGLLETSLNETDTEAAVTIPPDTEAQILRYYHAEKWRTGTIARQLHLHYDTVARVLAQAGLPR
ncbi:MAG: hypothetical protein P8Y67_14760, partial [Alphaproteobacteria bacterium]